VSTNSDTLVVTTSGDYTVSYTNGDGTSPLHGVTIDACAPNVVYQSSGPFTELTGDGDAFFEPGEPGGRSSTGSMLPRPHLSTPTAVVAVD
jgi:hypothetical protein